MPPVPVPSPDDNPYAPPTAELRLASNEHCWRDGRHVVLRRGGDLPHRCLRCNRPGLPRSRGSTYSWHSPWLFVLIPLNIIVFAVVALLVRRSVKLHPVLCDSHRRELRRDWVLCLALLAAGLLLLAAGLPGSGPGSPAGAPAAGDRGGGVEAGATHRHAHRPALGAPARRRPALPRQPAALGRPAAAALMPGRQPEAGIFLSPGFLPSGWRCSITALSSAPNSSTADDR